MRRLARSRLIIAISVASACYWAIAITVPRAATGDAIRGMLIALSFTVIIAYGAGAWEAARQREFTRLHHLLLGIVLSWAVQLAIGVWGLLFTNLGRPEWMVSHPFLFYLYFLTCIAAILHITAPTDAHKVQALGFTEGSVKLVAFSLLLGAAITFVITKWIHL